MKKTPKVILLSLLIIAVIISGVISFKLALDLFQKRTPSSPDQQPALQQPVPSGESFGIPESQAESDANPNWWSDLQSKAVETSIVDVTECKPDPKIARFTLNQQITLTNASQSTATLYLTETLSLNVPAAGELKLKANFGVGQGAYRYYCNSSAAPAGVFVVVDPSQGQ